MSYIDTSIIVAALDPTDYRSKDALKILEEEKHKIISELTLLELASVLSSRRELVSNLADKLGLDIEITISAILLYLMKRFNLRHRGFERLTKIMPLGRIYNPLATAIELSPKLRLKTLDLLHIAYVKLLKDEGEPVYKLITADADFEEAREHLEETIGVHLYILR